MTSHAVLRFCLAATAASLAALAGCTTTRPMDLPDVVILLDGGTFDTGVDGGFPDPVIDTCTEPGCTLGDTCGDPADCDDGCYCNGTEQCTGGVCVAGADPCENEMVGGMPMDIACTDEACLDEVERHTLSASRAPRCPGGRLERRRRNSAARSPPTRTSRTRM